jgi:hypothetical protein
MKTGRSLQDLAVELDRQAKSKRDYLADTRKISLGVDPTKTDGALVLQGVNGGMAVRPIAHAQLASSLGIPKPYYDRLLAEVPDLLARNVNTWLERQPAKKLVRTLDGEVRAILSDSYRPLDNLDLAEAVLPKLIQLEARVESCEVTDNRLYLKAVSDKVSGEVKVGDRVQAGVVVSNSEVGQGSLSVAYLDFWLVCLNGMIREQAVRKAHLTRGARGELAIDDAREYYRTETRKIDDKAFFMKVQDTVGAIFDQGRFEKRLDQYRESTGQLIVKPVEDVLEVTAERFSLNDGERSSILAHLIRGGDVSKYGLANAITRAAQDVDNYDRSTELEALGGKVIELPQSEWKLLAA